MASMVVPDRIEVKTLDTASLGDVVAVNWECGKSYYHYYRGEGNEPLVSKGFSSRRQAWVAGRSWIGRQMALKS